MEKKNGSSSFCPGKLVGFGERIKKRLAFPQPVPAGLPALRPPWAEGGGGSPVQESGLRKRGRNPPSPQSKGRTFARTVPPRYVYSVLFCAFLGKNKGSTASRGPETEGRAGETGGRASGRKGRLPGEGGHATIRACGGRPAAAQKSPFSPKEAPPFRARSFGFFAQGPRPPEGKAARGGGLLKNSGCFLKRRGGAPENPLKSKK